LSLRTNLDGVARQGQVELDKVHIPEAHVTLPTQSRRNLQSLSRPNDIILLRNGKAVDPKRARRVLSQDHDLEALGITALPPEKARSTSVVMVLDAPRNLWVRGQDLNLELGLSPDFRVELGEETDLFGEVRIIRGRLDVIGRRFDFQKNSVVRFTGPPTEPTLNVTAVYNNVRAGVKVSMHVQGQAGEIQLVPTSEPPLTESEIYTLLATGRTNLKRGSGGSEIGSAQAVSVLGSLVGTSWISPACPWTCIDTFTPALVLLYTAVTFSVGSVGAPVKRTTLFLWKSKRRPITSSRPRMIRTSPKRSVSSPSSTRKSGLSPSSTLRS